MIVSGRTAKVLLGALVLSVCVNLFAAAAVGGRMMGPPKDRPRGVERLLLSAPEAARPAFSATLERHRDVLDARAEAVAEARRTVARTLRDDTADAAALDAAFAELRAAMGSMYGLIDALMVETLAEVPPETRAAWAQRWERRR